GRSSGGRASGRATCTARSGARGRRGRPPRGSGGAGPCRSRASRPLLLPDVLDQLEPPLLVELVAVDDPVEDPAEVDAFAGPVLQLGSQAIAGERADERVDGAVGKPQLDRHLAVLGRSLEHRVESRLQVVEALEAQVQPRRDAAEHEVGDLVEGLLARNGEDDLVSGHSHSADSNAETTREVSAGSATIVPAPTTASPSYSTAACPGATP